MEVRKKIVGAFLCSFVTIPTYSNGDIWNRHRSRQHSFNSTLSTENRLKKSIDDLIFSGSHSKEALDVLQKSVGCQLTLVMNDTGKVTYTANTEVILSRKTILLMQAIDDHSVIATIKTTDNLSSSVTGSLLQGEFQGSTLDPETGIVYAKQEVNVRVLERADRVKETPGEGMLHEVIEAYIGAKINQRDQIGVVPPALIGGTNSVYQEAHANSPGGQNADEVVYEKNPPAPGQVIYSPTTEGCLRTQGVIIQTFPNKF
jgi:hypothetical protein